MPDVKLFGALEREGADTVGLDAGEIAGLGANGVIISNNPDEILAHADAQLLATI